MLPVIAFCSVAGGTTGWYIRKRRQTWLRDKPQRRFKTHLTDNSDTPFQHLQRTAIAISNVKLKTSITEPESFTVTAGDVGVQQTETHFQQQQQQQEQEHPYAAEIQQLLLHPKTPVLHDPSNSTSSTTTSSSSSSCISESAAGDHPNPAAAAAAVPPPLSETPLAWVDTPRQLKAVLSELAGVSAVAVDTEHNSQRSYLGMTCLIQLSTGHKDYLIDCLALHDHLHLLRSLMADPCVTKVLHGGANDVTWLQRDAHVYMVNVFDTEKAAQVLGMPERSLAHLLRRYTGVQQDKTLQTADWRLRPLPTALQQYARGDVHWLLLLAEKMIQALQSRSPSTRGDPNAPGPLLISTLQKSNSLCLKLYRKAPEALVINNSLAAAMRRYTQQQQQQQQQQQHGQISRPSIATPVIGAAAAAASSSPISDHMRMLQVRNRMTALLTWRDGAARAADEGPQFILPDSALLELADRPPAAAAALEAAVRRHVDTLNAAVAHLPYAARWEVSSAVRCSALHLVLLLRDDATTGGQQYGPGMASDASREISSSLANPDSNSQDTSAVAANGPAGPAIHVGGMLLPATASANAAAAAAAAAAANGGKQRKGKRREAESEFRERMIKKFSAKSKVYDNCRMLSTTGELLCFCDLRKLQWYIDKGLAELVGDKPPTIRLLFEHKNADQQVGLDGFYSTSRANRCVVCGQEQHYLRYRVVPSCYRRCFPAHLKSHRSHDIVLLCVDCHQTAHKAAEVLKRQIAEQYGVPLRPMQEFHQQQQQQSVAGPAAAAAAAAAHSSHTADLELDDPTDATLGQIAADDHNDDDDDDQQQQQQHVSSYKTGVPAAVSAVVLGHQARAAAVALVRFGSNIPEQRRAQLHDVIARFLGKNPSSSSSAAAAADDDVGGNNAARMVHLSQEDIEAALVAGLNAKKREKTLKKLRRQLTERKQQAAAAGGMEEAAAATAAAAAASSSSSQSSKNEDNQTNGSVPNENAAADCTSVSAPNGSVGSSSSSHPQNPSTLAELGHTWHGQQVVAAAMVEGGEEALHELVRRFRQAFVLACKPKYLPQAWDVEAHDVREFGEYSVYAKEEAAAAAVAAEGQENAGMRAAAAEATDASGFSKGDTGSTDEPTALTAAAAVPAMSTAESSPPAMPTAVLPLPPPAAAIQEFGAAAVPADGVAGDDYMSIFADHAVVQAAGTIQAPALP